METKKEFTTLDNGWRREVVYRKSGATAGRADVYYHSPCGKRFRSRLQVKEFMGTAFSAAEFDFHATPQPGYTPPPRATGGGHGKPRHGGRPRQSDSRLSRCVKSQLQHRPITKMLERNYCGLVRQPVTCLLPSAHDMALAKLAPSQATQKGSLQLRDSQWTHERRLFGIVPVDGATGEPIAADRLAYSNAPPPPQLRSLTTTTATAVNNNNNSNTSSSNNTSKNTGTANPTPAAQQAAAAAGLGKGSVVKTTATPSQATATGNGGGGARPRYQSQPVPAAAGGGRTSGGGVGGVAGSAPPRGTSAASSRTAQSLMPLLKAAVNSGIAMPAPLVGMAPAAALVGGLSQPYSSRPPTIVGHAPAPVAWRNGTQPAPVAVGAAGARQQAAPAAMAVSTATWSGMRIAPSSNHSHPQLAMAGQKGVGLPLAREAPPLSIVQPMAAVAAPPISDVDIHLQEERVRQLKEQLLLAAAK